MTQKPDAADLTARANKLLATDAIHAVKQHGVIPGLNRGPYATWPKEYDTLEQINHVIEHLEDLPCPGCVDAVRLLKLFRCTVYPPTEEVREEETADFV